MTNLWSVFMLGFVWLAGLAGAGEAADLEFDLDSGDTVTLTLKGSTITYRAYENLPYVSRPADAKLQVMNIYIPQPYFEGGSVDGYTAETAPIFFPNTVGGYLPGEPGGPGEDRDGNPNASFLALSRGYVVASPGVRGRTTQDESGRYTGKAPACIVDLKAAVRYLHHNDKRMPGDAARIVSNGTSAGGALSALLGATGNAPDYEPYLTLLGAAEASDDIFAVSAYCPITNLEHADMAYEWLFNGVNDYEQTMMPGTMPSPGGHAVISQEARPKVKGTLTEEQKRASGELKRHFTGYLNGLKLEGGGATLTLDADGNGSFKDYVGSWVITSAQRAMDQGTDLSALEWLTVRDGKVTAIDFEAYIRYAGRMKTAPAFDAPDLSTGENELFGTQSVKAQHFTRFGQDHDTAGGALAESAIVKMLNPMNYIGLEGVTPARHWRIRHGAVDSDTSLAVPVILATVLDKAGLDVNFAVPWGQGHGGDYDLDELFDWIRSVCAEGR